MEAQAEPGMARASAVAERRRSLVSEKHNPPVMAAQPTRNAYKSPSEIFWEGSLLSFLSKV